MVIFEVLAVFVHFVFEVVCQSLVLGLACIHPGIVLVVVMMSSYSLTLFRGTGLGFTLSHFPVLGGGIGLLMLSLGF